MGLVHLRVSWLPGGLASEGDGVRTLQRRTTACCSCSPVCNIEHVVSSDSDGTTVHSWLQQGGSRLLYHSKAAMGGSGGAPTLNLVLCAILDILALLPQYPCMATRKTCILFVVDIFVPATRQLRCSPQCSMRKVSSHTF